MSADGQVGRCYISAMMRGEAFRWSLLIALLVAAILAPVSSLATINSIDPPSARIQAGSRTSAQVNGSESNDICFSADQENPDPAVSISFDPPSLPASPTYTTTMNVATATGARPGQHLIVVHEHEDVDADGDCDESIEGPTQDFLWTLSIYNFTLNPTSGPPGNSVAAAGAGWDPGAGVTIRFARNPTGGPDYQIVSQVRTDAAGNFSTSFPVPPRSPATYPVQACHGTCTAPPFARGLFQVTAAPALPPPPTGPAGPAVPPSTSPSPLPSRSPSPSPSPSPGGGFEDDAIRLGGPLFGGDDDSGGGPKRSRFVAAVRDLGEVSGSLEQAGSNALLALVLLLVILFPAELFNSTYEENHQEIRGWFGAKGKEPGPLRRLMRWTSRSWWGFPVLASVTAVLYGLLDPGFAPDITTLSLLLGIGGALVLVTLAAEIFPAIYVKSRTGARPYLRSFPGALPVAILCVALSRLVEFEPGYLYGILAAGVFRGGADEGHEGRSAALTATPLLVLAAAAWLVWLPVKELALSPEASFGLLTLEALLVATFVSALEGVLVALLPLKFLDGFALLRWNRLVWGLLFFLSLFGFVHILLDPSTGFLQFSGELTSILVAGLFVGFGVFSVAFWAYFRFRPARDETMAGAG